MKTILKTREPCASSFVVSHRELVRIRNPLVVAARAADAAEQEFGPYRRSVATSLSNLAVLYMKGANTPRPSRSSSLR
jgi:hypothetical protein